MKLRVLVLFVALGLVGACSVDSPMVVLAEQEPVMQDLSLDGATRLRRTEFAGSTPVNLGRPSPGEISQYYQVDGDPVEDQTSDPRVEALIDQARSKAVEAGWDIDEGDWAPGYENLVWEGTLEREGAPGEGWAISIGPGIPASEITVRIFHYNLNE